MGRKLGGTKKMLLRTLLEYLKDSDRPDSKIAKELGVCQATVSRLKSKLLKEGYITHFSAIPNFAKTGYEILAFSFVKFNMKQVPEIEDRSEDWAMSHPEIVFTARADGLGADAITISLHKDYAAYKDFFAENKNLFGKMMAEVIKKLSPRSWKPWSGQYIWIPVIKWSHLSLYRFSRSTWKNLPRKRLRLMIINRNSRS